MAEEQRCQERHRLCANNCGFFGSPATNDLCSKCYRDFRIKEHNASSAMIAVKNSLSTSTTTSSVADVILPHPQQQSSSSSEKEEEGSVAPPAVVEVVVRANRCGECRRKVGLTGGFRCRCGSTYCGAHRYPESHACGFDFKSAGKEAIARANPVVKADKLSHKI